MNTSEITETKFGNFELFSRLMQSTLATNVILIFKIPKPTFYLCVKHSGWNELSGNKEDRSQVFEHVSIQKQKVAYLLSFLQFNFRDLACRNILVVDEEYVKIGDFGLARVVSVRKNHLGYTSENQTEFSGFVWGCSWFHSSRKSDSRTKSCRFF